MGSAFTQVYRHQSLLAHRCDVGLPLLDLQGTAWCRVDHSASEGELLSSYQNMFVKHVNFGHKLRGRVVNRVTDLIIRDFLKYLLKCSEAMFGYLVKCLRIEWSWET